MIDFDPTKYDQTEEQEATIGSMFWQGLNGFVEGFTTLNLPNVGAPKNDAEAIARKVGGLLGFIGYIPNPYTLATSAAVKLGGRFGAKALVNWGNKQAIKQVLKTGEKSVTKLMTELGEDGVQKEVQKLFKEHGAGLLSTNVLATGVGKKRIGGFVGKTLPLPKSVFGDHRLKVSSIPLMFSDLAINSKAGVALSEAGKRLLLKTKFLNNTNTFIGREGQTLIKQTVHGSINLGLANSLAATGIDPFQWKERIDEALPALWGGMQFGAGDGLIGNMGKILTLAGMKGQDKVIEGMLKTIAGSLWNGLPSTMHDASTPEQIYEYLLGAWFGFHSVNAKAYETNEGLRKVNSRINADGGNIGRFYRDMTNDYAYHREKYGLKEINDYDVAHGNYGIEKSVFEIMTEGMIPPGAVDAYIKGEHPNSDLLATGTVRVGDHEGYERHVAVQDVPPGSKEHADIATTATILKPLTTKAKNPDGTFVLDAAGKPVGAENTDPRYVVIRNIEGMKAEALKNSAKDGEGMRSSNPDVIDIPRELVDSVDLYMDVQLAHEAYHARYLNEGFKDIANNENFMTLLALRQTAQDRGEFYVERLKNSTTYKKLVNSLDGKARAEWRRMVDHDSAEKFQPGDARVYEIPDGSIVRYNIGDAEVQGSRATRKGRIVTIDKKNGTAVVERVNSVDGTVHTDQIKLEQIDMNYGLNSHLNDVVGKRVVEKKTEPVVAPEPAKPVEPAKPAEPARNVRPIKDVLPKVERDAERVKGEINKELLEELAKDVTRPEAFFDEVPTAEKKLVIERERIREAEGNDVGLDPVYVERVIEGLKKNDGERGRALDYIANEMASGRSNELSQLDMFIREAFPEQVESRLRGMKDRAELADAPASTKTDHSGYLESVPEVPSTPEYGFQYNKNAFNLVPKEGKDFSSTDPNDYYIYSVKTGKETKYAGKEKAKIVSKALSEIHSTKVEAASSDPTGAVPEPRPSAFGDTAPTPLPTEVIEYTQRVRKNYKRIKDALNDIINNPKTGDAYADQLARTQQVHDDFILRHKVFLTKEQNSDAMIAEYNARKQRKATEAKTEKVDPTAPTEGEVVSTPAASVAEPRPLTESLDRLLKNMRDLQASYDRMDKTAAAMQENAAKMDAALEKLANKVSETTPLSSPQVREVIESTPLGVRDGKLVYAEGLAAELNNSFRVGETISSFIDDMSRFRDRLDVASELGGGSYPVGKEVLTNKIADSLYEGTKLTGMGKLRAFANKIRGAVLTITAAVSFHSAIPMSEFTMVRQSEMVRDIGPKTIHVDPSIKSNEVRTIAEFAVGGDAGGKPFVVVDKSNARMTVFDAKGKIVEETPALLGKSVGDRFSEARKNARTIEEVEASGQKVTPAGRFTGQVTPDREYGSVLRFNETSNGGTTVAIHQTYTGTPSERRPERIASSTTSDNRVSFGCVNVPKEIYDRNFSNIGDRFTVYVLPEKSSFEEVGLPKPKEKDAPVSTAKESLTDAPPSPPARQATETPKPVQQPLTTPPATPVTGRPDRASKPVPEAKPISEGLSRVIHSGGAKGSDSAWETIGKKFGFKTNHYFIRGFGTPRGNTPIDVNKPEVDAALARANQRLGRKFPTAKEYVNNLLRRNIAQVTNSDMVIAIGEVSKDLRNVEGGTGWAVASAIIDTKNPVFAFDQTNGKWYEFNRETDRFAESRVPTPTDNFAGIGTREINKLGQEAIESVFAQRADIAFAKEHPIGKIDTETAFRIRETVRPLTDFLERHGFKVEEHKDLIIDLSNKMVGVDPTNIEQVSRAIAAPVAEMMSYSQSFYDVHAAISKSEFYQKLRQNYLDRNYRHQAASRRATIDVFRNLLVRGFAEGIAKRANIDRSMISRIKKFVSNLIDKFKIVDTKSIEHSINQIVDNTFRGEEFIRTTEKEGYKQVRLQDAFDSSPIAKRVLTNLTNKNKNLILTGSTAFAEQGTVYRPETMKIHDVDLVNTGTRESAINDMMELYPNAYQAYRFGSSGGYDTTTFIIPPEGGKISNVQRRPEGNKIISYEVVDSDGRVIGTYKLNYEVAPSGRIINEKEIKTGEEGTFVDFFTTTDARETLEIPFIDSNGLERGLRISHFADPFAAKLEYSRFKDIWDYNRFMPFGRGGKTEVKETTGEREVVSPTIVEAPIEAERMDEYSSLLAGQRPEDMPAAYFEEPASAGHKVDSTLSTVAEPEALDRAEARREQAVVDSQVEDGMPRDNDGMTSEFKSGLAEKVAPTKRDGGRKERVVASPFEATRILGLENERELIDKYLPPDGATRADYVAAARRIMADSIGDNNRPRISELDARHIINVLTSKSPSVTYYLDPFTSEIISERGIGKASHAETSTGVEHIFVESGIARELGKERGDLLALDILEAKADGGELWADIGVIGSRRIIVKANPELQEEFKQTFPNGVRGEDVDVIELERLRGVATQRYYEKLFGKEMIENAIKKGEVGVLIKRANALFSPSIGSKFGVKAKAAVIDDDVAHKFAPHAPITHNGVELTSIYAGEDAPYDNRLDGYLFVTRTGGKLTRQTHGVRTNSDQFKMIGFENDGNNVSMFKGLASVDGRLHDSFDAAGISYVIPKSVAKILFGDKAVYNELSGQEIINGTGDRQLNTIDVNTDMFRLLFAIPKTGNPSAAFGVQAIDSLSPNTVSTVLDYLIKPALAEYHGLNGAKTSADFMKMIIEKLNLDPEDMMFSGDTYREKRQAEWARAILERGESPFSIKNRGVTEDLMLKYVKNVISPQVTNAGWVYYAPDITGKYRERMKFKRKDGSWGVTPAQSGVPVAMKNRLMDYSKIMYWDEKTLSYGRLEKIGDKIDDKWIKLGDAKDMADRLGVKIVFMSQRSPKQKFEDSIIAELTEFNDKIDGNVVVLPSVEAVSISEGDYDGDATAMFFDIPPSVIKEYVTRVMDTDGRPMTGATKLDSPKATLVRDPVTGEMVTPSFIQAYKEALKRKQIASGMVPVIVNNKSTLDQLVDKQFIVHVGGKQYAIRYDRPVRNQFSKMLQSGVDHAKKELEELLRESDGHIPFVEHAIVRQVFNTPIEPGKLYSDADIIIETVLKPFKNVTSSTNPGNFDSSRSNVDASNLINAINRAKSIIAGMEKDGSNTALGLMFYRDYLDAQAYLAREVPGTDFTFASLYRKIKAEYQRTGKILPRDYALYRTGRIVEVYDSMPKRKIALTGRNATLNRSFYDILVKDDFINMIPSNEIYLPIIRVDGIDTAMAGFNRFRIISDFPEIFTSAPVSAVRFGAERRDQPDTRANRQNMSSAAAINRGRVSDYRTIIHNLTLMRMYANRHGSISGAVDYLQSQTGANVKLLITKYRLLKRMSDIITSRDRMSGAAKEKIVRRMIAGVLRSDNPNALTWKMDIKNPEVIAMGERLMELGRQGSWKKSALATIRLEMLNIAEAFPAEYRPLLSFGFDKSAGGETSMFQSRLTPRAFEVDGYLTGRAAIEYRKAEEQMMEIGRRKEFDSTETRPASLWKLVQSNPWLVDSIPSKKSHGSRLIERLHQGYKDGEFRRNANQIVDVPPVKKERYDLPYDLTAHARVEELYFTGNPNFQLSPLQKHMINNMIEVFPDIVNNWHGYLQHVLGKSYIEDSADLYRVYRTVMKHATGQAQISIWARQMWPDANDRNFFAYDQNWFEVDYSRKDAFASRPMNHWMKKHELNAALKLKENGGRAFAGNAIKSLFYDFEEVSNKEFAAGFGPIFKGFDPNAVPEMKKRLKAVVESGDTARLLVIAERKLQGNPADNVRKPTENETRRWQEVEAEYNALGADKKEYVDYSLKQIRRLANYVRTNVIPRVQKLQQQATILMMADHPEYLTPEKKDDPPNIKIKKRYYKKLLEYRNKGLIHPSFKVGTIYSYYPRVYNDRDLWIKNMMAERDRLVALHPDRAARLDEVFNEAIREELAESGRDGVPVLDERRYASDFSVNRTTAHFRKRVLDLDGYSENVPKVLREYLAQMLNLEHKIRTGIVQKNLTDTFHAGMLSRNVSPDHADRIKQMMQVYDRDVLGFISRGNVRPQILKYLKDKVSKKKPEERPWEYETEFSDRTAIETARKNLKRMGYKGAINDDAAAAFQNLEAKYEVMSLLFHPKTSLANAVGATLNIASTSSFDDIKTARRMLRESKEWRRFVEEQGISAEFSESELSLEPRFEKPEYLQAWKDAQGLIKESATKAEAMRRVYAMLKERGIDASVMRVASMFMQPVEQYMRELSFTIGFNKATSWGWTERDAIEFGRRSVKATQYLYNNAEKPEFARTSIGKILTRFMTYFWSTVGFQNRMAEEADVIGVITKPNVNSEFPTDAYGKWMTAIAVIMGLSTLYPFSIFDTATPPHIDYLKATTELMFGPKEISEDAFFGSYGLSPFFAPLPSKLVLRPTLAAMSGDWDKYLDQQVWTLFPFGRFARSVTKSVQNPSYVPEIWAGIPLHSASKTNSAIKKLEMKDEDIDQYIRSYLDKSEPVE